MQPTITSATAVVWAVPWTGGMRLVEFEVLEDEWDCDTFFDGVLGGILDCESGLIRVDYLCLFILFAYAVRFLCCMEPTCSLAMVR